jgi:hypothetical protein
MEELVDLIGKVKIQDNTCTAIQIYVDDRHTRSFIRGIVDHNFRKSMLENHNMGIDYITFLKYEPTDTIVFDVFYDWEIVPKGGRVSRYPVISSYNVQELVGSLMFSNVIRETFPEPFTIKKFQQGFKHYINIYWEGV